MNPIANTLDQHKKANRSIRATTGKMAAIYKQARERLNSKLQKYVLSDPNPSNGKWMVGLINELEKNYAKLEEAFVKEMGGAIPYVAQSYYFDALSDLGNTVTGKLDKAKIELLRKDAWNHIAGMTKNMEKSDVAWLRQTAGDVFRLAGTSGMTAQETRQMLLGKILMRPEKFQFTDAGGRMWDNKTYCEMLTRTVLLNAGRQTYFDTCAENGCDVVQVTVSGNPCPDCAVWENRLLSISGNTPGLPTVAEAIAAGLCHPNCTHSFVAVGDYVREQDFTEDGRPKEGLNSPGKEEKNDKEAWSKYSAAHKPEKKPKAEKPKPSPKKEPEPKPEAEQPELPLDRPAETPAAPKIPEPDLSEWNAPEAIRVREEHNRQIMEWHREELEGYAREYGISLEQYIAAAEKKLQKLMDESSFYRRDPADAFMKILRDGKFKSQFETNTSKGALSFSARQDVEQKIWGYRKSVVKQRPIYGTVNASPDAQGKSLSYSSWYGDVICKFKSGIRYRTTFTNGDSLGAENYYGSCQASKVNLTSVRGIDILSKKVKTIDHVIGEGYNEAQFHGVLRPGDIEKVFFERSVQSRGDFAQIVAELEKLGIPFEILP